MLTVKEVEECEQRANNVAMEWPGPGPENGIVNGVPWFIFKGKAEDVWQDNGAKDNLALCATIRELRELLEEARQLAMRMEYHDLQNRFYEGLK